MSTIIDDLLLRIRGDASGAKDAISETSGGLRKLVTPANLAKAAMAGLSAAMALGVRSTQELNQLMSRVQAETGATAEELEAMRKTVQSTFKSNEDSYVALTNTVTALRTQMGLTAEQIDRDIQSYLDFAKVTGQDNVAAVENLDDVLDAWGATAEDAAGIMDMLIVSHQQYGGKVSDNTRALNQLAPAAKTLGLDLEQTNGILNLFASAGVDAAQGTMALTFAAKQFKSPEEFKVAIENLSRTEDQTKRTQKAVEIFGSRAGVMLVNAFGPGTQSMDDFVVSVEQAQGATAAASAQWDDNFNVKFELFRKRITGTVQELTEKFGPAVSLAGSAVLATTPFIKVLGSSMASLTALLNKNVVPALKAIWAVMMANPIILIGALIAGLVAGIVHLYKTNERARDVIDRAWYVIKQAFLSGVDITLKAIQKLGGWIPGLGKKIEVLRDQIREMIDANAIKENTRQVKRAMQKMKEEAGESLEDAEDATKSLADEMAKLGRLYELGDISIDQYTEALVRARDAHARGTEEYMGYHRELQRLAQETTKAQEAAAKEAERLAQETTKAQEAVAKEAERLEEEARNRAERARDSTIREADRLYSSLRNALKKHYDAEESSHITAIQKRIQQLQAGHDEAIAIYQSEMNERLRIIDEETAGKISGLEAEINQIDAATREEERIERNRREQERIDELRSRLGAEQDAKERARIEKDLNEALADQGRRVLLESREVTKKGLREEIQRLRDQAAEKRQLEEESFAAYKAEREERLEFDVDILTRGIKQFQEHYANLQSEAKLNADAQKLIVENNQTEIIELLKEYEPEWFSAGKSFGERLIAGLLEAKAGVQDVLNGITDQIRAITGSTRPDASNPGFMFTDLDGTPGLAAGGITKSRGGVIVGEDGPEWLNLPRGAQVAPLSEGGSTVLNLYVTGNNIMDERDGEKLGRLLVRTLKAQGVRI